MLFNNLTLEIGIFALTESSSEKSISATARPVDNGSETGSHESYIW